jgi:hypothetical protein
MHRDISERWWRRWAKWSFLWVLGWILALLFVSGGHVYAPSGFLSQILAVIFAMPVLVLAARWGLPRIRRWADRKFDADRREQQKTYLIAWIARFAMFLGAIFNRLRRGLASGLKADRWERTRASAAGCVKRLSQSLKPLVSMRPVRRWHSTAATSAMVTNRTVEDVRDNAREGAKIAANDVTQKGSGAELTNEPTGRGQKGGTRRARKPDKKKRRRTARAAAASSGKR